MKDYTNVNENIRLKIIDVRNLQKIDQTRAKKQEDEVIVSLAYLVHSAVFKYKRFSNYDDLYQEGMIGLIKAVKQYDINTTFHFTRYAMWWIKARVMRSIRKMNIVIMPVNDMRYFAQCDLQENDMIDECNPEINFMEAEVQKLMSDAIDALPEKHQEVIKLRYGLNNGKKHNLQALSEQMDMTREGIRQLEHRVINTLKHNALND